MAYIKGQLPNPKDIEEIKTFFKDHEDYTLLEIALKYKIKPVYLKRWRVFAGIKSNTEQSNFLRSHKNKKPPIERVNDQAIWDNKEWFVDAYSKHGIIVISRIIGRTIRTVQKRLARYGITTNSHHDSVKSKNPCNTREWIVEHYRVMGIKKMAKLAGVSIYTIYDWMINYDIYPNTRHKSSAQKRWNILREKRLADIAEYNKTHGTSIQSFKEIIGTRSKN